MSAEEHEMVTTDRTTDDQVDRAANDGATTGSQSVAPSRQDHTEPERPSREPLLAGINVLESEKQFAKLARTLSQESRLQTRERDVENNAANTDSNDEEFDLVEYLAGTTSEASQAGLKRKHIGVTWSNLSVKGVASMSLNVQTFPDAFINSIMSPIMLISKVFGYDFIKLGDRYLLQKFDGSIRPGQMCLVLGRPGSGCSTFLKTIANHRSGFLEVDGEIQYGGMSSDLFSKRYRGEVIYCEEDDNHHPTLTVEQTLDAALRLKTPGKKLPRWTGGKFRSELLNVFLKMLNMEHTRNTLVGNAFVRGVSGGERKRVSVLEALTTRACVLAWDNVSRGLDASTALDYAKSMRILTDVVGLSTFVSLYQAGEGIYQQFDKVMVIDQGRCVYFGPRDKARDYFISLGFADLPRQTTADYLTGCTDEYERRFQPGRSKDDVPCTPEALELAYRSSGIFADEMAKREEYVNEVSKAEEIAKEFQLAVREDKNKHVGKKSVYTVPYWSQIYTLWRRQLQMISGDKVDIFVSYTTAIITSLMMGSLFWKLPESAAGAFTRGGVLFVVLLFNSLTAFTELPAQMSGRPIVYRHGTFGFYRPSALTIAQLFADFPIGIPRVTIFGIITYFMTGLAKDAGAFFIFIMVSLVLYYAFRSLFALFGVSCRSFDMAARIAAVIICALIMFAGYTIPRDAMRRWLYWITYINPVYYGFEALMINEFRHLNLKCVDTYITPRGAGYPEVIGPNQVCTLPGSSSGSQTVPGMAYLSKSFGYKRSHLWLDVGITFVFLFGLTALTAVTIELLQKGASSSAFVIMKKPNKEEKALAKRFEERLEKRRTDGVEEGSETSLNVENCSFTWSKLRYTVPVRGGQRCLLNDVYGYVKPGTLTALMGASGAGKTTLLDVLADRKSIGVIEGQRLVDGHPVTKSFQRGCGYAEQQDIHEGTATVREALRFSAYLRQPYEVSIEDKNAYVEQILELLEMQDIANAQIGMIGYGLGVADRKRVTIAVELAARPGQMLFLDEPTSGLDGQGAYTIVRLLTKLAKAGQTILCTIHQPNSLLFEQFDRLLLLEQGGHTVYFGPVGKDSCHIVDYFARHGALCPREVNPAEFMLDAIGAGSQKRIGPKDWKDVYLESNLFQENLKEIEKINHDGQHRAARLGDAEEYAAPFLFQLQVVLKRTLISSWRMPDYQYTRVFQHGAMALITGLLFMNLDNSVASLQFRTFCIFLIVIIPAIILSQIEPFYIFARSTFLREDTSKMYSPYVFAAAQILSELPYALLCAITFFILFYFPIGLQTASSRAGYFFAMLLLSEVFSITLGQAIAALNPSIYMAGIWTPVLVTIFSLLCGVTIPYANMTKFWRSWLYWINPMTYVIGGLLSNELHQLKVACKPSELALFSPPSNTTCLEYAQSFIADQGGYLVGGESTTNCQYCQYTLGDDYLKPFNTHYGQRGRNISILLGFCVFNAVITLIAARYTRYTNR